MLQSLMNSNMYKQNANNLRTAGQTRQTVSRSGRRRNQRVVTRQQGQAIQNTRRTGTAVNRVIRTANRNNSSSPSVRNGTNALSSNAYTRNNTGYVTNPTPARA